MPYACHKCEEDGYVICESCEVFYSNCPICGALRDTLKRNPYANRQALNETVQSDLFTYKTFEKK